LQSKDPAQPDRALFPSSGTRFQKFFRPQDYGISLHFFAILCTARVSLHRVYVLLQTKKRNHPWGQSPGSPLKQVFFGKHPKEQGKFVNPVGAGKLAKLAMSLRAEFQPPEPKGVRARPHFANPPRKSGQVANSLKNDGDIPAGVPDLIFREPATRKIRSFPAPLPHYLARRAPALCIRFVAMRHNASQCVAFVAPEWGWLEWNGIKRPFSGP